MSKEERREKYGKGKKGVPLSEERKERLSEYWVGKPKSEEHRKYTREGIIKKQGRPVIQYSFEGNFIKEWDCLSDAQRHLNIRVTHITACCNGRQKTASGYIWKRQFDERLKLDREKLTFDKDKHREDNQLKDKISLRQAKNRSNSSNSTK